MNTAPQNAAATLLHNGTVLIAGAWRRWARAARAAGPANAHGGDVARRLNSRIAASGAQSARVLFTSRKWEFEQDDEQAYCRGSSGIA
jgi:hypothetical protein